MSEIPLYPVDLFCRESVIHARAVDDALREAAPVVRLADGTVIISRHADVAAGLSDWRTFSNTSRPWHDPSSLRPEILLTDDPPRHTRVRTIVADALSTHALDARRADFEQAAQQVLDAACAAPGPIDAVADLTQPFVGQVLADLLGLAPDDRGHMHDFGHIVWATLGPPNELFEEAMAGAGPVMAWLDRVCDRSRLAPGGVGERIFAAADAGTISQDEAKLLLQTILSAGADTTVITMAATLGAFGHYPEVYQEVRAEPRLTRAAFEECLRWDSPSRMAGRITTREVEIEGITVPAGTRVGLLFAAANRDPRAWQEPETFDVHRDLKRSLGFGYGLHACVGRALAQLEASTLLNAFVRRIARVEIAGPEEPWMTTIGHGPARLPVRLQPA
jgi:4-methoxybenzoate monooxygenase (O-demethylating)